MDVTQAPVAERLSRAADLISEAADAGVKLAVLPELFNTGYEFHERNYNLAEPIDGKTATWMKMQAAHHNLHLVGSLALLDQTDIYNSALMVAPDGRIWRHDKNYIVLWERAYFREGNQITVADTDLGKIGLMVCSDTLRPDLWARYAGRVQAMVLMFSPGDLDKAELLFPDGFRLKYPDFEATVLPSDKGSTDDDGWFAQIQWMPVPMVAAGLTGVLRTRLPKLDVLLQSSRLSERATQASEAWLEMALPVATVIAESEGRMLVQGTLTGDGVVQAEIEVADTPPQPIGPQPKLHVAKDHIAGLVKPMYQASVQQEDLSARNR
ncbi:MAG: carbon-nitrogen hydrolase family protein [Anaerolineae bacterium]|nr:carbon-nitrogen hydrolase family protein [Anaerolineae bacterium]